MVMITKFVRKTVCLMVLGILAFGFTAPMWVARSASADEQVIRYNLAVDPTTLDPTITDDAAAVFVIIHAFEGLLHERNGTLVPGIAEWWDVSEDGKTYTFHLRDAKWSDGKQVTAGDFEYAWKRVLDPATGALYATLFYCLKGGEARFTGNGKPEDIGVTAKDDKTLVVELENPTPYFLQLAAYAPFSPVRSDIVEAAPEKWALSAGTYIGNGPYIMKEYSPAGIVLEKNPNYWNASEIKMPRIECSFIVEVSTEMAAFENEDLNILKNIPPAEWRRISELDGFVMFPMISTTFCYFNTEKKPLDDVRVRKALAFALDRGAIVRNVTPASKPAANIVSLGLKDSNGADFSAAAGDFGFAADGAPNADEARKLLADAGFPEGKGFPELTYTYNTSEGNKQIAEAMQEMWRRELGINVRLINQEWKVFLDTRKAGNYDIARGSWIGDFADPMTFLDIFLSPSVLNASRWKNPEYDKLISESMSKNGEARDEMLYKADRLLMNDMPMAPIFHQADDYVIPPYIKGVECTPTSTLYFGNTVIER
jgi:oligopeptide transport system substrate-binding protein